MKHIIPILILAFTTTAGAQDLPNYVATDGLMGWFALDGHALDLSENESNGTIDGAISSTNRLGESDASLEFGYSAHEELSRVVLPGLVTDVHDSFTVAFWGKPSQSVDFPTQGQSGNEIPPNGQIVLHAIHGHFFGPDNAHAGFGMSLATNGFSLIEHSNEWQTAPVVVEQDLSDWHHFAIVYSDGRPAVFIDGTWVAEGLGAERTIHISFGTDPWYPLGGIGHGYTARRFQGQLDDMGFWSRSLSEWEVNSLYLEQALIPGCTDGIACNYTSDATTDDASCVYPPTGVLDCELGGAYCGDGTYWDASIQLCVGFNECPSDVDGDGIIGVNDLMQVLSMFGTDCPAWACGESIHYQGYDYETVQIGDQCWFAENARYLPQVSPPDVGSEDDGGAHAYAFGYGGTDPTEAMQTTQYQAAGALYNQMAVDQWDLCPSGWHVPDANEILSLSNLFGGTGSSGGALKTTGTIQSGDGVWNEPNVSATNASGFSAIPGGARNHNEVFTGWSSFGYWRTTTPENGEDVPWHFCLAYFDDHLTTNCSAPNIQGREGYAVRCLQD
jgi:uncharacterized protein (TIGR02145 family)